MITFIPIIGAGIGGMCGYMIPVLIPIFIMSLILPLLAGIIYGIYKLIIYVTNYYRNKKIRRMRDDVIASDETTELLGEQNA